MSQDIVQILRAMNEDGVNHVGRAADVIEGLQKANDHGYMKLEGYKQELAKETDNKKRIEHDLLKCFDLADFCCKEELVACQAAYERVVKDCNNLTEKVIPNIKAEYQAREKVLRDALMKLECGHYYSDIDVGIIANEARATPTDDSALKAALKAERDRCASELMSRHANGNHKYDTREDCIFAIRALGG